MTRMSPPPAYAFVPRSRRTAPQMSEGSSPPARRAVHVSAVVVLLPCVPAIATTRFPLARYPQASSRFHTGRRFARAAATSGFVSPYALERITTSAPSRFAASKVVATVAPSAASAAASGHVPLSEPLTWSPRASSRRAIADIPMPPIPTTWNRVTRIPRGRGPRSRSPSPHRVGRRRARPSPFARGAPDRRAVR